MCRYELGGKYSMAKLAVVYYDRFWLLSLRG